MSDEYIKQIIKDRAAQIRAEVEGGMLYGKPVDMNDPDAVLVAAVVKAEMERYSQMRA